MSSGLLDLLMKSFPEDNEELFKYHGVYKKEKDEMVGRKIKQILEQEFQLKTLGEFYSGLNTIIKANDILLKDKLAVEHNNGWLFITINPKPSVTFPEFQKKVEKLVNRNMFSSCIFAYEQRGSTPDLAGKGFHVHILAKRNLSYKPFNCKKNTKNTCKSLVGRVEDPRQLNIQVIGDEFAQDKKEYFLGQNKTGEGKQEKQSIDKIWRKSLSLRDFYEKTLKKAL